MNESELKHGGIKRNKLLRKWHRARRPHIDRHVGKVSIPLDWTKGVDNTGGIKIKNQFQSSSCGGQAASYCLQIAFKQEISAKSIYSSIAYPGGGTTIPAIEGQITTAGANLESAVPSYRPDSTTDEPWMTDRTYRNSTLDIDALTKAGWKAVTVPRNSESIGQAVNTHGGVIWEIQGQNGNPPGWLSVQPVPPIKGNENEIWTHFMAAGKAYLKDSIKTIRAFQSWGIDCGDGGLQDFNDTYFTSPYFLDCFTFVRTEDLIKQKTNILMAIIAWLKMLATP